MKYVKSENFKEKHTKMPGFLFLQDTYDSETYNKNINNH